jgi:HK97 gp10 family phage protein
MSVEVIRFGNVPEAVREGSEKAILELVTRVTAQAKALAPVDTGQLRGSIMGRVEKRDVGHQEGKRISERAREGEGYVGTAELHGIYQEFGTRNTRAQPHLRPAIEIEANGAKAKEVVKKFEIENVNREVRKSRKTTVIK